MTAFMYESIYNAPLLQPKQSRIYMKYSPRNFIITSRESLRLNNCLTTHHNSYFFQSSDYCNTDETLRNSFSDISVI